MRFCTTIFCPRFSKGTFPDRHYRLYNQSKVNTTGIRIIWNAVSCTYTFKRWFRYRLFTSLCLSIIFLDMRRKMHQVALRTVFDFFTNAYNDLQAGFLLLFDLCICTALCRIKTSEGTIHIKARNFKSSSKTCSINILSIKCSFLYSSIKYNTHCTHVVHTRAQPWQTMISNSLPTKCIRS